MHFYSFFDEIFGIAGKLFSFFFQDCLFNQYPFNCKSAYF